MNRMRAMLRLTALIGVVASRADAAFPLASPIPLPIVRALAADSASTIRPRMLEAAMMIVSCYPENPTEEQMQGYVEQARALLDEQMGGQGRFVTDTESWRGEAIIGNSNETRRTHLTYSFPNDGVLWGVTGITQTTGPNNLNSVLSAQFGSANLDRGREYFRQALASWERHAGVTYDEVADNNSIMDISTTRSPVRGDIRFGAYPRTLNGPLASNFFPFAGGDVMFNSDFFIPSALFNPANSYRYLRNTMAHEHGHGLGYLHVVPCSLQKTMEPFLTTVFDMLQIDERRGAGANYGDRFSGNQSAATAVNFGNLTTPVLHSVIERHLSTNGQFGLNNSDEDWFRFTLSSPQTVTITIAPTGGSYLNGPQVVVTSLCDGPVSTVNAQSAGNLNVELRDSTGAALLASATTAGAGVNEVLAAGTRAAGTYTVRVFDAGPNPVQNQIVQLYDMLIRIGSAPAPPTVVAGINKRIAAGANCFFFGDIITASNEGSLLSESYEWDLDGDGVFETVANTSPLRQYSSNGVYPVTLRVNDLNGTSGTDILLLTVFGGITRVLSCVPPSGALNSVVPIEITGTNLKNVIQPSMVSISGMGVSIIGSPVPNTLGTSVTGLSLVILPGASLGNRNITVTNSDGSGTGLNVFTVVPLPPAVPEDFGLLSPADLATTATRAPTLQWNASTHALTYDVVVETVGKIVSEVFSASTDLLSIDVPAGALEYDRQYQWRVSAINDVGSTPSTPAAASFFTPPCFGDADGDRSINFADITEVLTLWAAVYPPDASGPGDANSDDTVNFADITEVLEHWNESCQ